MSSSVKNQYHEYLFPNYAPLEMLPEKGVGARLWDSEGKAYIDFAGGIAVSALGHAHPELVKVLNEQANKYWHVSNLLTTPPAMQLAKQLVDATFADKVIFSNSGAEANEAALKLARRYAIEHYNEDKNEIIAFNNSFHGRTFFTVCVGGQAKYSDGFGPKPGGITHLPYNDLVAVSKAISKNTCAVIIEPILGEGGVRPADQSFAEGLRQLCDENEALLIFDEIQTGVMRTGDLYRYQGLGVEPDILTTAKGLGGGFPIGAMLAKAQIAQSFSVGVHGTTFGGNPLACAVAGKVIEIVDTDEMRHHVRQRHQQFVEGLKQLNDDLEVFEEIRGKGLLLGCQLKGQHSGRARDVITKAQQHGLLLLVAGPDVVRIAPPLIISEEEVNEGLAVIRIACESLLC